MATKKTTISSKKAVKVQAKAKTVTAKAKTTTKTAVKTKAKPKAAVKKAPVKATAKAAKPKTAKPVAAAKIVKPKAAPKAKAPTKIKTKVATPKKAPVVKTKKPTSKKKAPAGAAPSSEKKGEEYMNETQLAHFQEMLNNWKQQLIGETNRTVEHMQRDASNFPDPVDRASQEEEFSLELRTRDRERKLIRKINEAMERIQEGDYGYCLECGSEIGVKRLEARPTATQCIECKTIAEIREKQTGTSGFEE